MADIKFLDSPFDKFVSISELYNDKWILGPLLIKENCRDPEIDSAGLQLDKFYRATDRFQGKKISQTYFRFPQKNKIEKVLSLCGAALWIPSKLLPLREESLIFSKEFFAYYEDIELFVLMNFLHPLFHLGLNIAKFAIRWVVLNLAV